MQRLFVVLIAFSLSACTMPTDAISDDYILPSAFVGSAYSTEIYINGVYSLDKNGQPEFVGKIEPSDKGLYLQYCNDSPAHNCIQVKGVPVKSGMVKVRVYGSLSGTNGVAGASFDKTYTTYITLAKYKRKPKASSGTSGR